MMNKIACIIVTWNSSVTIEGCLKSLEKLNADVYVVDNHSADSTVKLIQSKKIKLIKSKINLGFGAANNEAVKEVKSDYILFLNPDAEIKGQALRQLASYLDRNPGAAVVGPRLVNPDQTLQREMAPFPNLASQILILLRLHRLKPFSQLAYPNYDYEKTQEAEHLMGSALLIRKSVFEQVGGFDKNIFLWFEDTDLLKRIKDSGFKIIYYPKAEAVHLVGQSTKQLNPIKRQSIWNKSLRYYFKKHKSKLEQLILEPFIILSYAPALIQWLLGRIRGTRFIKVS